jgi:hypothetical protein
VTDSVAELGKYEYEYRPPEYEYEYEYQPPECEYEYEYQPSEYEYEYEYHQNRTQVRVLRVFCPALL